MQRHLQSPVDKLEKLLAFGLPDGEFHRQPISSWYFRSEPPPATGGPHIYLCVSACVCVSVSVCVCVYTKMGSLVSRGGHLTPPYHTAISHVAIHLMA